MSPCLFVDAEAGEVLGIEAEAFLSGPSSESGVIRGSSLRPEGESLCSRLLGSPWFVIN